MILSKEYYKQVLTSDGNKYQKLDFDSSDKARFWIDMVSKNKEG